MNCMRAFERARECYFSFFIIFYFTNLSCSMLWKSRVAVVAVVVIVVVVGVVVVVVFIFSHFRMTEYFNVGPEGTLSVCVCLCLCLSVCLWKL